MFYHITMCNISHDLTEIYCRSPCSDTTWFFLSSFRREISEKFMIHQLGDVHGKHFDTRGSGWSAQWDDQISLSLSILIEGYQVAANLAWPFQGETWINIFTKHHFFGAHLALHQEIAGLKKEVEDLRTGKVLTAVTVVKEPDPNPNQKEACTPLGIRFRVNWAMVVHSCSNQYIQ